MKKTPGTLRFLRGARYDSAIGAAVLFLGLVCGLVLALIGGLVLAVGLILAAILIVIHF